MARQDHWDINSDITRKPWNTADFALRFAANKVRPYLDEVNSISAGPAEWADSKGREVRGTYLRHYNTDIAYISSDGLRLWLSSENWSSMTSKVLSALRGAMHRFGFRETVWAIRKKVGGMYYGGVVEFVEYKRKANERDAAKEVYEKSFRMNPGSVWNPWSTPSRFSPYLPNVIEVNGDSHQFYKVLNENGEAKDGGHYTYSLPDGDRKGDWTEPTKVFWCASGYHVTTMITHWGAGRNGNRVFEVECSGTGVTKEGDSKAAFPSIRLVRELTPEEIAIRASAETAIYS